MTAPPLVDCLIEDDRWDALPLDDLAKASARAVLGRLDLPTTGFEISLLACSDSRIAALNADFRGKPQPTNVLSWPSAERGAQIDGAMPDLPDAGSGRDPEALGDIALAWETCRAEAETAGRAIPDHVAHLIVHGLLHLLGFDHERDADAALMERLEVDILGNMGLPDPYETDR